MKMFVFNKNKSNNRATPSISCSLETDYTQHLRIMYKHRNCSRYGVKGDFGTSAIDDNGRSRSVNLQ